MAVNSLLNNNTSKAIDTIGDVAKRLDTAVSPVLSPAKDWIEDSITPTISRYRQRAGEALEPAIKSISSSAGSAYNALPDTAKKSIESLLEKANTLRQRIKYGPSGPNFKTIDSGIDGIFTLPDNKRSWLNQAVRPAFGVPDNTHMVAFDDGFLNLMGAMAEKKNKENLNFFDMSQLRKMVYNHEVNEGKSFDKFVGDMSQYSRPGELSRDVGSTADTFLPVAAAISGANSGVLGGGILAYNGAKQLTHASKGVLNDGAELIDSLITGAPTGSMQKPLDASHAFISANHADPYVILEESNYLARMGNDKVRRAMESLREDTGELSAIKAVIGDRYGKELVDSLDPRLRKMLEVNYRYHPSMERKIKELLNFEDTNPYVIGV